MLTPTYRTVSTAEIAGTYGTDTVQIAVATRGPGKGKFFTRGGGYAGRVAYPTQERAERSVSRCDVRFVRIVAVAA